MKSQVSNCAALITGAAHRIGRACAIALAGQGMGIVIHYRSSRAPAEALATTIRSSGGKAWTLQGDLDNPDMASELFTRADKLASGRIRVLLNSASMYEPGRPDEATLDDIRRNLNVNALTPFMLSRAFARREKPGVIINLLDTRIVARNNGYAAYHLSKILLAEMTRMLAQEFAPDIRVNGIAPGVILPPPGKSRAYAEAAAQANPMKRMGSTKDIVGAVRYLIDATFVTGQILYIDGGYHLRGALHE